ncbi:hypothetical protein Bca4012_031606 [Brassica carinata]|uniref:Uncharacterized protein n=1 Tax=Brassica carinata TaxID=52824 RepID=A0A8X7UQX0_BRACI|nr:hypothetical protein Bca52824_047183 [Brassica carinata]
MISQLDQFIIILIKDSLALDITHMSRFGSVRGPHTKARAFRDLGEPLNHKECRIVSLATLQSPLIAGSTSVRAGSRSRLLHPSRAAASGMDLRCTAWDSYADKFESFLITRPYKEVNICILRVWRIDRELGSGEFIFRAVNNMSELLFNPPVVEAINAKHKMLLNPAFQCTEDGYNGDL